MADQKPKSNVGTTYSLGRGLQCLAGHEIRYAFYCKHLKWAYFKSLPGATFTIGPRQPALKNL